MRECTRAFLALAFFVGVTSGCSGTDPLRSANFGGSQVSTNQSEVEAFSREITKRVRSNFVYEHLNDLPEDVLVRATVFIAPEGQVTRIQLLQSSGNPSVDSAFMTAVEHASPLPVPPGSIKDRFTISFRPRTRELPTASPVTSLPDLSIPEAKPGLPSKYVYRSRNTGVWRADGWVDAKSSEGRFTVDMPGLYSEKVSWFASTDDRRPVSAEELEARTESRGVVRVERLQFRNHAAAKAHFELFAGNYTIYYQSAREFESNKYRAVEAFYTIPSHYRAGVDRVLLVGDEVFFIIAFGPISERAATIRMASHIFNSLKFENAKPVLLVPPAYALIDDGSDPADSPAVAVPYAEQVRQKVKPNIVYGGENLPDDISAVVKVLLGPDGAVLRTTLDKSSGVPAYDAAVLRAIERSSPLPVDKPGQPGSRTLRLTFQPK